MLKSLPTIVTALGVDTLVNELLQAMTQNLDSLWPPPISVHECLTFWVVAYERFDCRHLLLLILYLHHTLVYPLHRTHQMLTLQKGDDSTMEGQRINKNIIRQRVQIKLSSLHIVNLESMLKKFQASKRLSYTEKNENNLQLVVLISHDEHHLINPNGC